MQVALPCWFCKGGHSKNGEVQKCFHICQVSFEGLLNPPSKLGLQALKQKETVHFPGPFKMRSTKIF